MSEAGAFGIIPSSFRIDIVSEIAAKEFLSVFCNKNQMYHKKIFAMTSVLINILVHRKPPLYSLLYFGDLGKRYAGCGKNNETEIVCQQRNIVSVF